MTRAAVLFLTVLRSGCSLRQSRVHWSMGGVRVLDLQPSESPEEWIMFFEKGTPDDAVDAFCQSMGPSGCTSRGHPSNGVPFAAVRQNISQMQMSLASAPRGARFMVPDATIPEDNDQTLAVSTAPETWNLDRVGARGSSSSGKGVNVYVLDTGVRSTHVEFGGRAIPTTDASGWGGGLKECKGSLSCARDSSGHGTHVAGTVGATNYGVAPESTIRVMKRGSKVSKSYASMDWLVQNAVMPAVLSCSFGTQNILSGAEDAVDAVVDAGITVVVASGNWKMDSCGFTFAWIPSAIGVGATADGDMRASFSNFGSCNTIMAPGDSVTSLDYKSDTGKKVKSGTSMATPLVSGTIALMLEKTPDLTPAEVRSKLLATAETNVISGLKDNDPEYFLRVP